MGNTKNYLKLGILLFLISLTLANCQKDDAFIPAEPLQNTSSKGLIIETNFNILLSKESFSHAFTKVFNHTQKALYSTASQRTIMENEYGFTIVQDGIKVISKDGFTSYTMLIERAETNEAHFENLVIAIDNEGIEEPIATLIKYTPDELTPSTLHNSYKLNGSFETIRIDYNIEQAKITTDCVEVSLSLCDNDGYGNHGEVHVAGENCNMIFYTASSTDCTTTFTDDLYSNPDGASSGSGGNGSNNGNIPPPNDEDLSLVEETNSHPVTTVIVIPKDECVLSEENANAIAIYLESNTIPPSITPTPEAIIFTSEAEEAICNGEAVTFAEYIE